MLCSTSSRDRPLTMNTHVPSQLLIAVSASCTPGGGERKEPWPAMARSRSIPR